MVAGTILAISPNYFPTDPTPVEQAPILCGVKTSENPNAGVLPSILGRAGLSCLEVREGVEEDFEDALFVAFGQNCAGTFEFEQETAHSIRARLWLYGPRRVMLYPETALNNEQRPGSSDIGHGDNIDGLGSVIDTERTLPAIQQILGYMSSTLTTACTEMGLVD